MRLILDIFRFIALAPAASAQLEAHGGLREVGALLLRVRAHDALHAELRACAAEVHAVLTGGELGLLELPPTARPAAAAGDGDGDDDDESPLRQISRELRRLQVVSSEVVLGGRPGKAARWGERHARK